MIVVTGATGKLGRLVVAALLRRVPGDQIVAAVRTPSRASDLAAAGVLVRALDYDVPSTLATAFSGASRVLLISSNEIGKRAVQHRAVVGAAKTAGVQLLAYTSVLHANTSGLGLASEHKATEDTIVAAGIPFVFLRNGWYVENYTENLGPALAQGAFFGCAAEGRIAAATRADLADAAAVVLTQDAHRNHTYELGGDQRFTMRELAETVSAWAGRTISYQNLPFAEYRQALLNAGLAAPYAELLADADAGISRGDLDCTSGDLHRLIGKDTMTLARVLATMPRP